jgi:uncharacterized protein YjbJ (UPF0337 family)
MARTVAWLRHSDRNPAARPALAVFNTQERGMSSTTDKIKGTANQAIGKIKQGVGEATDDHKLKGEGKLQEAKGKVQNAVGDVKAAVKKAADL